MLVLTRRVGDGLSLYVGKRYVGHITIEGMESDRREIMGRVRLGLDLDPRLTILRDELVESSHADP